MKIKLVCCDIDGTLTDGTVFVSEQGEVMKQFSHRDGRAFHLIRERTGGKVKVAFITSEEFGINHARTSKLLKLGTVSDFIQGADGKDKLAAVDELCGKYGVAREDVLFIGDDTNDLPAMEVCGRRGCPADALPEVRDCSRMIVSKFGGGRGAVREIIDAYLKAGAFEGQEEANQDRDYDNP